MKKFIFLFFFFNNYFAVDFCDKILNTTRSAINLIPAIIKDIPDFLMNKVVIGIGLTGVIYLSTQNPESIPFFRSVKNIIELNQKKRLLLFHNKLLNINPVCLRSIIHESNIALSGNDSNYMMMLKRIMDLKIEELRTLLYPQKNRILKNKAINAVDLIIVNDVEIHEDEELNKCILQKILKTIDQEKVDFDIDNSLLHLDYLLNIIPSILEMFFFFSIVTYAYEMI